MSEPTTPRRFYRVKGRNTWHTVGDDDEPLCVAKAAPGGTYRTELSLTDRAWICRKCLHCAGPKTPTARPSIAEAPPVAVFLKRPRKASTNLASIEQQNYLMRYGHATAMQAAGLIVSEASRLIDGVGGP